MSERRASVELDWRFRMTGSEMLAMALCVLSKAAAARERMLLEVRWWRGSDDEPIETELAWRRDCETGGGDLVASKRRSAGAGAGAGAGDREALVRDWVRSGCCLDEGGRGSTIVFRGCDKKAAIWWEQEKRVRKFGEI